MNRKQFLELVGRSALFAAASPALDALAQDAPPDSAPLLGRDERATLDALAEAIIPAGDGMPSAVEMGAAAYLDGVARRDQAVASALRESLASVGARARAAHGRGLHELAAADRVALLLAMEKDDADRFRAARDLVYEAYYTNPLVWKRLGYDFIGPDASGPPLEPFEEALLERVRALPRLYRSAP